MVISSRKISDMVNAGLREAPAVPDMGITLCVFKTLKFGPVAPI
jgi:hypothetical protein